MIGAAYTSTSIKRRRTIDRYNQPAINLALPFASSTSTPQDVPFDVIKEDRGPASRYRKSSSSPSPSPSPAPAPALTPRRARFLRLRMSMFSDVSPGWQSHWLSRLRSALRLLVVVLSGAVIVFLVHTLEIRRGNRYLDLRKGELPMTWPARTNVYPTVILLAVALASFVASVTNIALAFRRSFRRPARSSNLYRMAGGCLSVVLWAAAITAFTLLDRRNKASLGRYSCTNQNVMSNGRYQYRAVCEEQGVAFYIAIAAAFTELAVVVSLATSSYFPAKQRPPYYKDDHEKKRSMSFGVTGRHP